MPYDLQTRRNWIDSGETAFGKVKSEYEKAIEYVENIQTPTSIPEDKEYIQYNLLTSRSLRRQGEMLAARKSPVLLGGGEMTEPFIELFNDKFEENRFYDKKFPSALHNFYPVGLAGFKYIDNPKKMSKYGIGCGEIEVLRYNEIRLDPTARDAYHDDDKYRYHPKRALVEYAQRKWPEYASQIAESGAEDEPLDNSGLRWCTIYDMEYVEQEFREVDSGEPEIANKKTGQVKVDSKGLPKKRMIEVEVDVYYQCKIINKFIEVMKPTETGYPVYRIIPAIYFPRTSNAHGRYPFGLYGLHGQGQDLLNVTYSVLLDAVKASIKQIIIATGILEDEAEEFKDQASKTNAMFLTQNSSAKVQVMFGNPLAPALTQFADRIRFMIDEIDQMFAPDKGQVSGDLSGRAINSLQAAGQIPQITAQSAWERTLTDLGICEYHYIRTNMIGEFSINRKVGLESMNIPYNTAVAGGVGSIPPFHIVHGGYVNDLRSLPRNARMKIAVEMNHAARRQEDINIALLLRERRDLSLKDELKALYPMNWEEKMSNVIAENKVLSLVNDIAETDPQAVDQLVQVWQQIKPQLQQANTQLQKQMRKGA